MEKEYEQNNDRNAIMETEDEQNNDRNDDGAKVKRDRKEEIKRKALIQSKYELPKKNINLHIDSLREEKLKVEKKILEAENLLRTIVHNEFLEINN